MSADLENDRYVTRLRKKILVLDTEGKLDFAQIDKAIYWAKKYHAGQRRKSGEPFYTHPLEVAYIISDYLLKTDVIVASILHDIVEDTEVTVEMIEAEFGTRIAEMVDRLTRDRPDGSKLTVEEILNNAYKNEDQEVLLVKLVDRLHNMQTINSMPAQKIEKTIKQSLQSFLIVAMDIELPSNFTRELVELCEHALLRGQLTNLPATTNPDSLTLSPIFQNEINQILNQLQLPQTKKTNHNY